MHITHTEVPAPSTYAATGASRPEKSALINDWVVLVPVIAVCILLALLEVAAATMSDADLLRMMPA